MSSREPKSVERSVRTLIQELIDMRVEPEDFCDRLERLLNASPQPCLIGFLKVSTSNTRKFVLFFCLKGTINCPNPVTSQIFFLQEFGVKIFKFGESKFGCETVFSVFLFSFLLNVILFQECKKNYGQMFKIFF